MCSKSCIQMSACRSGYALPSHMLPSLQRGGIAKGQRPDVPPHRAGRASWIADEPWQPPLTVHSVATADVGPPVWPVRVGREHPACACAFLPPHPPSHQVQEKLPGQRRPQLPAPHGCACACAWLPAAARPALRPREKLCLQLCWRLPMHPACRCACARQRLPAARSLWRTRRQLWE